MDWTHYTLGQRIKLACSLLNMDMQQAAKQVGMSYETFYHIASERGGKYGPTVGSLGVICTGLGVNICWVITGQGEVFSETPPQTQKTATPEGVTVPVMPLKSAKLPAKRQPRRG